jgi:hypothetical protein
MPLLDLDEPRLIGREPVKPFVARDHHGYKSRLELLELSIELVMVARRHSGR